jgi:hypothetical protein
VHQPEIGVVTYYSLASGFLTGKYRQQADLAQSQRGSGIGKYLNPRGMRIIDTLEEVAAQHHAKPGEVALAWLMGREGVTAPIASATSVAQVELCSCRSADAECRPAGAAGDCQRLTRRAGAAAPAYAQDEWFVTFRICALAPTGKLLSAAKSLP